MRFRLKILLISLAYLSVVMPASLSMAAPATTDSVPQPKLVLQTKLLTVDPMSLAEVMREALLNHPNIRAGQNLSMAANSDLEGAKWNRFPTVSAQYQAIDTGLNNTQLRVEQPLWTGGRITGQIDRAQAGLSAANATLIETEQRILQETAFSVFEIMRAKAKLDVAIDNVRAHETLVESIERRVRSEISPMADLTQASTRLRQANAERIQFQRQHELAIYTLEQVVGRRVERILLPKPVTIRTNDQATLFDQAIQFSPARRRLLADIDGADADVKLTRSRLMPQVVAGYQVQTGQLLLNQNRDQLYIGLQMQPDAGLSTFSAMDAANARKAASQDALESIDRDIRQQLNIAMAEIETFGEQLGPAKDNAYGANNVMESYLRQFQVGKKNWLEVLNAQREKAIAHFALADIEAPLQFAHIKILLITGEINANNIRSVL
jgi:outer membrane protein, adhesin transport system